MALYNQLVARAEKIRATYTEGAIADMGVANRSRFSQKRKTRLNERDVMRDDSM